MGPAEGGQADGRGSQNLASAARRQASRTADASAAILPGWLAAGHQLYLPGGCGHVAGASAAVIRQFGWVSNARTVALTFPGNVLEAFVRTLRPSATKKSQKVTAPQITQNSRERSG